MKNISGFDRFVRVSIAAICLFLFAFSLVPVTLGIILLIVATVLFLTAMIGFCPLYWLFGVRHKKTNPFTDHISQ